MRFTLLNILILVVAVAAIITWQIEKSQFDRVLSNYGEYPPESPWDEVGDGDLAGLVSISDLSFVYCYSDIVLDDSLETELEDLVPPSDAERNGRPSEALFALINENFGFDHRLSFENATAEACGNSLYWKVTWSLFPANGGFSGVPYQYIGFVRPDGSAVQPRIYLRDYYGSFFNDEGNVLFSVMPMEKLLPTTDRSIDDTKLIEIATDHLYESLTKLDVKTKFRFERIERRTYSPKLRKNHNKSKSNLEVWAVIFIDNAIPKSAKYGNSALEITVWVANDLTTSAISVGEWELEQ